MGLDRYGREIPAGCKDVKLSAAGAWRTTYTHIVAGDVVMMGGAYGADGMIKAAPTVHPKSARWLKVAEVRREDGKVILVMAQDWGTTAEAAHTAITRQERPEELAARLAVAAAEREAPVAATVDLPTLAELAADAHYAAATAGGDSGDAYDEAVFDVSRAEMIAAISAAYPDVDAEAVRTVWVDSGQETVAYCVAMVRANRCPASARGTTTEHTMADGTVVHRGHCGCPTAWETGFHYTMQDALDVATGHGTVARPLYEAPVPVAVAMEPAQEARGVTDGPLLAAVAEQRRAGYARRKGSKRGRRSRGW